MSFLAGLATVSSLCHRRGSAVPCGSSPSCLGRSSRGNARGKARRRCHAKDHPAGQAEEKEELPKPLKRSPEKAQRTYAKTHDSAVETYGEGEQAHRTAYAALKHTHEKVGERWVPKDGKGPSDPRAKDPKARERSGSKEGTPTYGGVDVERNSKQELYERAKDLRVAGRSTMSKGELAEAISRQQ
jgi:cation transport regulator ChaB